jgi:hypothetical protein
MRQEGLQWLAIAWSETNLMEIRQQVLSTPFIGVVCPQNAYYAGELLQLVFCLEKRCTACMAHWFAHPLQLMIRHYRQSHPVILEGQGTNH